MISIALFVNKGKSHRFAVFTALHMLRFHCIVASKTPAFLKSQFDSLYNTGNLLKTAAKIATSSVFISSLNVISAQRVAV